jgi:hypothetical protein
MQEKKDMPLFEGYQPRRQEQKHQEASIPGYQPPQTKVEVNPPPKKP